MTDAAHLVGSQIAYHRKRLGLSQTELAGRIGRSDSWVSQVERGVRSVDRLSVLQTVADALGVTVSELRDEETTEPEPGSRPEAFESLRLTLTGHPATRTVLGGGTVELMNNKVSHLSNEHSRIWPLVHASRYNELAPVVADLIPKLEYASRAAGATEQKQKARKLLTDTYQAVAAMLAKLGESDAAWIAADRATFTAESLNNPLAVAASLFRMAHVFLTLGQLSQVQAIGTTVINGLDQQPDTIEVLSLRGAFHLVLAIAAARDDNRTQAYTYLDQAREIAARIGEDRNDFDTEFGPTNVALHAIAVAVELGDAGHALDLAREVNAENLSPERQARYSLDLARAHEMRRQIGEALHYLVHAEQLTPEQVRSHGLAKSIARNLIQLSAPHVRPELREIAERFGVAP